MGLSRWFRVKEFTYNAGASGDADWISGWGRSPGEGNGNPLQYFAWGSPRTEKPGRLQTTGSQKT